jgi:hypothetical protein
MTKSTTNDGGKKIAVILLPKVFFLELNNRVGRVGKRKNR